MSKNKKLIEAFNYVVNNQQDKAEELLKQYILEKAAEIYNNLEEQDEDLEDMERENIIADAEEDFEKEIRDEETFSDLDDEVLDDAVDEIEHEFQNDFDDLDLEDLINDLDDVSDKVDDLESEIEELDDEVEKKFTDLKKALDKLQADNEKKDDLEPEDDLDLDDSDLDDESNEVAIKESSIFKNHKKLNESRIFEDQPRGFKTRQSTPEKNKTEYKKMSSSTGKDLLKPVKK